MTSSVLETECLLGAVTRIVVPPECVETCRAELLDAERADLAAMVEAGDHGRMVVTAGGIDWPFGGL